MGVPNKRLKKLLMTTGIALGVYAGLKYLLPLVIPFCIALGLAEMLRPLVCRLERKLAFHVGRHEIRLPKGLIGGMILFWLLVLLMLFGYMGGAKLLKEGKLLIRELPGLARQAELALAGWGEKIEEVLRLEKGSAVQWIKTLAGQLKDEAWSRVMPYVMGNSMAWVMAGAKGLVFLIVTFMGTVLALQEEEQIRAYIRRSAFHEEYVQMVRILKVVGAAYGKTQLLILLGTVLICIGGLYLAGNPYYGLLGVLIGLLDALPFIGTGTILFPWAAACFFRGRAGQGIILVLIYLVSYFLRQFMESKVMGKKAGLSPFVTLAAVYAGIRLFGILGVVLGPLGFLIIRESVDA